MICIVLYMIYNGYVFIGFVVFSLMRKFKKNKYIYQICQGRRELEKLIFGKGEEFFILFILLKNGMVRYIQLRKVKVEKIFRSLLWVEEVFWEYNVQRQ